MIDTAPVATIIDAIVSESLNYAVLLAAIGTLSMAFIELLKGLTSFRRHFHRRELKLWMSDEGCRSELLVLAAGGEHNADVLYDQPTERLLGQIQAAANLSLEYPDRYPLAYAFFTREDLQLRQVKDGGKGDGETWAAFASRMASDGFAADATLRLQQENDGRAAQQARVRLGNLIARRLDMFQNRTQYRWARLNQIFSIIVGAVLTGYALASSTYRIDSTRDFVAVILLSLLAGMLAPFAKDVVAAISGLRAKA